MKFSHTISAVLILLTAAGAFPALSEELGATLPEAQARTLVLAHEAELNRYCGSAKISGIEAFKFPSGKTSVWIYFSDDSRQYFYFDKLGALYNHCVVPPSRQSISGLSVSIPQQKSSLHQFDFEGDRARDEYTRKVTAFNQATQEAADKAAKDEQNRRMIENYNKRNLLLLMNGGKWSMDPSQYTGAGRFGH